MQARGFRSIRQAGAALLCLAALTGCDQPNTYVPPPPPKVTVAPPVSKTITLYLEATGSSVAVNSANLVARIPGFVQSVNYQDGDLVKKGAVLFTIEPESYQLKHKQAQAAEESARATVTQTQLEYDRQADLASRGSASKAALDNATAGRDNARANLTQAEINTRLAAINADYTSVIAPFDGIVTARTVSTGEYVGANSQPSVLATIVQLDPIYVNFAINERDVLRIRAEMRRRGLTPEDLKQIAVEVGLQNEADFPHKGRLDYASPEVDASTGTLAVRALLANPERVLLPGLFVRVRIPMRQQENALLVPDAALGTDQSGRYLLVAGSDGVVAQRPVVVGPLDGALRVIEKGVGADDRVIVSGLLRAVPGQKVDAQPAAAAPAGATK